MTGETAGSDRRDDTADEPTDDPRFDVSLRGLGVDRETRCVHYHTPRDVIAIEFPCCRVFYPCYECHEACCDHDTERWPPDRFDERAILCGVCRAVATIAAYLECDHRCPHCNAAFNPGCVNHWERYFAFEGVPSVVGDESDSGKNER